MVVLVGLGIVVAGAGVSPSGRVVVVAGGAVVGGAAVEAGGPASGTTGVAQATAARPSTATGSMPEKNDLNFTDTDFPAPHDPNAPCLILLLLSATQTHPGLGKARQGVSADSRKQGDSSKSTHTNKGRSPMTFCSCSRAMSSAE